jgi:hypothetical protein
MGERSHLSKLRTRHQSRGIGPESNHYRNRDLPELRLVRADRNTSRRSSASEEADFGRVTALCRDGKWQLLMFLLVRHFAHVCADELAGDLRIIICTANQACFQS